MPRKPTPTKKDRAQKKEKHQDYWEEEFGRHMIHQAKRQARHDVKTWWFDTFNIFGPLVGAVITIVFIAIGIGLINLFNMSLGSAFLTSISHFFATNLPLFFGASLFFGYANYIFFHFPKEWWFLRPITIAAKIALIIWIIVSILTIV